jgi:CubicO group peptidase (beta-lactamase class C family)
VDEKRPTLVQVLNGEKPANTAAIRVDFGPGTRERYSGGGVTIEQLLMMDITGKPFPALMKETVLDKIGMTDSSLRTAFARRLGRAHRDRHLGDGIPVHGKWHVYPEMAAAGSCGPRRRTSQSSLSKIALARQGKSRNVLAQEDRGRHAHRPARHRRDQESAFALPKARPGEFGHNGRR